MVSIQEVIEIVDSFPSKNRNLLKDIEIVLIKDATVVSNDGWVRARYIEPQKLIVIYSSLIKNKADLKEILLHEIGHVLGLDHDLIRH